MYEMIVCNTGQGHINNLWTPVSLVSAPTLPESCVYFQWMLTVSSIFSLAVVLLDFVRYFEAAKAALRATLTHSLLGRLHHSCCRTAPGDHRHADVARKLDRGPL